MKLLLISSLLTNIAGIIASGYFVSYATHGTSGIPSSKTAHPGKSIGYVPGQIGSTSYIVSNGGKTHYVLGSGHPQPVSSYEKNLKDYGLVYSVGSGLGTGLGTGLESGLGGGLGADNGGFTGALGADPKAGYDAGGTSASLRGPYGLGGGGGYGRGGGGYGRGGGGPFDPYDSQDPYDPYQSRRPPNIVQNGYHLGYRLGHGVGYGLGYGLGQGIGRGLNTGLDGGQGEDDENGGGGGGGGKKRGGGGRSGKLKSEKDDKEST